MDYSNKKVLIVDDDEGVCCFVEAVMTDLGWNCVDARNGEQAVLLSEMERPDLIIMDVDMPELNGFEAFKQIRDNPLTADIPIIMLTGINEDGAGGKYNALQMENEFGMPGPEGFVDKPVDGDFLHKCILGVIG